MILSDCDVVRSNKAFPQIVEITCSIYALISTGRRGTSKMLWSIAEIELTVSTKPVKGPVVLYLKNTLYTLRIYKNETCWTLESMCMDSGVHGGGSQSPCSEMENYHRRSLTVAFYNLDESHSFQMLECPEFIVMTKPQLSKNLVSQGYWPGFVIVRQLVP